VRLSQNDQLEPLESRVGQDSDGLILVRIVRENDGVREFFLEAGRRLPVREYCSGVKTSIQVKDFLAVLGFDSWDSITELDVTYMDDYGVVVDYQVVVSDVDDSLESNFVSNQYFTGGSDE
jgi:hypothetical protein